MKKIKAFIFDLDGTLIDTEKIYRRVWPQAVSEFGYELTDDMYLRLRSLGKPYAQKQLKEWFGAKFDYSEVKERRTKLFNQIVQSEGITLKKGAKELLSYLKSEGFITAVATATALNRAEEYLNMTDLYKYFDRIISASLVERGKPSPDVYLYACQELGIEPMYCVAVEDAPNGIYSAYNAGLRVIMVPDLTEPEVELTDMLWHRFSSLEEIVDFIRKDVLENSEG